MLIFWIAMVLLIGALQYAMPQLTRRDIFFSVTVAPEFRDTHEARRILAEYRRGIVAVTVIALVPILAIARGGAPLIGAALLMMQVILSLLPFVRAHRRAVHYASVATAQREAALTPQPRMAGVGLLLIGPYILLACAPFLLRAHWNEIPNPMPGHWDFAGNPNGWMPKTPLIFWTLIGTYFVLCAVCTLVVVAMTYWSRQMAVIGAKADEERRFRWIGIAMLVAAGYLIATLALLPLYPHAFAVGGVASLMAIMIVGARCGADKAARVWSPLAVSKSARIARPTDAGSGA
jgi:uncharacterized membrane protein